ncbi:PREDICTED: uteroglobin [Ceratotherium simum simum]|uniref:Uteroglobin n=1 Tax=Ceratotherium simum simum TaxID=73337 RepID=A0ABM1D998_CERSS|nr:PREDICTED: uteroglobin [Ceratotherium simum simum]
MKLAVALALVTLALYCSPASAETCPSFLGVIQTLFLGTPASYEVAVEPFSPDADMKDAGIQLKKLVDTLPEKAKENVIKLMVHGFLRSRCSALDSPSPWLQRLFGPFCNPERRVPMQMSPGEQGTVISPFVKRLPRTNQSLYKLSSSQRD